MNRDDGPLVHWMTQHISHALESDSWTAAGAWHHLRKGQRLVEAALPKIPEDGNAKLSGALRVLLAQLLLELDNLQRQIDEADGVIKQTAEGSEACRRLKTSVRARLTVPGGGVANFHRCARHYGPTTVDYCAREVPIHSRRLCFEGNG